MTYTAPATHSVDAGDASWAFSVPQPTVTYTAPAQDHTVDAGDVAWAFVVPQPTVTYTPPGGVPLAPVVPASDEVLPTPLVATSDVQDPARFLLQTTADLLITQWRNQPRMRGTVEIWLEVAQEELLDALSDLRDATSLEHAKGVWLDYLGERLGVRRPWTTRSATDPSFGFDDAGVGFDQGVMHDERGILPTGPIGDNLFLKLLRARVFTLLSLGTIDDMRWAVEVIDPSASVRDNHDMSFDLYTSMSYEIGLADSYGCLPRPSGVRMDVVERGAFGFDDAGVGFDQGRMKT